jgi:hypothetical protein
MSRCRNASQTFSTVTDKMSGLFAIATHCLGSSIKIPVKISVETSILRSGWSVSSERSSKSFDQGFRAKSFDFLTDFRG